MLAHFDTIPIYTSITPYYFGIFISEYLVAHVTIQYIWLICLFVSSCSCSFGFSILFFLGFLALVLWLPVSLVCILVVHALVILVFLFSKFLLSSSVLVNICSSQRNAGQISRTRGHGVKAVIDNIHDRKIMDFVRVEVKIHFSSRFFL